MNNQLIPQLREYADWAEDNICEVPITLPDVLREAADALDAYRWRDVKTELPEVGRKVYVRYSTGLKDIDTYDGEGKGFTTERCYKMRGYVVKWAPLPEEPEVN